MRLALYGTKRRERGRYEIKLWTVLGQTPKAENNTSALPSLTPHLLQIWDSVSVWGNSKYSHGHGLGGFVHMQVHPVSPGHGALIYSPTIKCTLHDPHCALVQLLAKRQPATWQQYAHKQGYVTAHISPLVAAMFV